MFIANYGVNSIKNTNITINNIKYLQVPILLEYRNFPFGFAILARTQFIKSICGYEL